MKKLLFSGIAAAALMMAGTVQAAGLSLAGETGVARTPLAMSLAPMQVAIAADYVASEDTFVPMRAEIGLPMGIEIGGAYWYMDTNGDPTVWGLNAKWVLPKFVENLGLAVGGHYNGDTNDFRDANGFDVYGVATYPFPMGEGMALIPSVGLKYQDIGDDVDENGFKFFGSLLFKAPMWAVGAEYIFANDDLDGKDADDSYWFGGRFYLNPMITLQAGYLNNADIGSDKPKDGVFHIGAQFAFGTGM